MARDELERFTQELESLRGEVQRTARRLLGSQHDAEEAAQAVLVSAMSRLRDSEPPENLEAWLRRVTINHCLNQLRDARRRRSLLEAKMPRAQKAPPEHVPPDMRILVRRLLEEADPLQAHAAFLVYLCGMTQREAAAHLGVSQATVANRLAAFRRYSLECLAEAEGDDAWDPPP